MSIIGTHGGISIMRKAMVSMLAVALLGVAGCSFFGLFAPKGPQTITFFFSNEMVGELKPCG